MAKSIRRISRKRKIFTPHLQEKLFSLKHALDQYFDVKTCEVINKKKKQNIHKQRKFCFL